MEVVRRLTGLPKPMAPLLIFAGVGAVVGYAPVPVMIVLGLLAAALCARKPLQPMAISVIIMLSLCELYLEVGGRTIRPETLLIFVLLAGVTLPFLTGRRRPQPSPLYLPLLLFVAIIGCSLLVGICQPVSAEYKLIAAVGAVRTISAYLMFVVVYNFNAEPEKKLSAVINATLLFSFVWCGVALLQILYHQGKLPFGLPSVLTEHKPGANVEWGREIFGPFIGQTGAHLFAFMLSLQALTVFCVAIASRSVVKKTFWMAYFALMALILVRVSVRVAVLSLFASCCAVLVVKHKTLTRKVASALAVGGCALFALCFFATHDFQSDMLYRIRVSIPLVSAKGLEWQSGTTMMGRFYYWDAAWQIVKGSPFFGAGYGMFEPVQVPLTGIESLTNPHNGFLHVLSELGIIGFGAFAWLMFAVLREVLRARKHSSNNNDTRVADALLFATFFVWLPVSNIAVSTVLLPKVAILQYALLGARLGVCTTRDGTEDQQ